MRRYGWKQDADDRRDYRTGIARTRVFPPKADLRLSMPQVIYDQADSNSCVGQALGACVQHAENDEWMPSASYIYWNARDIEGTTVEDSGCMIRNGIKAIVKCGVCHVDYWPYKPETVTKKPPPDAYVHSRGGIITSYLRVGQTLLAIKGCIVDGFPVVFGFQVFDQFESDDMAERGVLAMPQSSKDVSIGGHAVVIVGYNDDWRSVIVRNSYGPEWGMRGALGHFAMPYDYLLDPGLCSDFWIVKAVG